MENERMCFGSTKEFGSFISYFNTFLSILLPSHETKDYASAGLASTIRIAMDNEKFYAGRHTYGLCVGNCVYAIVSFRFVKRSRPHYVVIWTHPRLSKWIHFNRSLCSTEDLPTGSDNSLNLSDSSPQYQMNDECRNGYVSGLYQPLSANRSLQSIENTIFDDVIERLSTLTLEEEEIISKFGVNLDDRDLCAAGGSRRASWCAASCS